MALIDNVRQHVHIKCEIIRCVICEFVCTTILMFVGCSVNAQAVINRANVVDWDGLTIGWGLAILLAVTIGYRISGSHLNPAVSCFLFTFGRIGFVRFVLYTIAQVAGGFVGSLLAFIFYYDKINHFDYGHRQIIGPNATAGIFATYPPDELSTLGAFIAETLGTSLLAVGICAISDDKNAIPIFVQPLFIALLIIVLGAAHGMNPGFAYNPARDLSPRLFSWFIGYGWEVISFRNYMWLCVPIAGPFLGGLIGAWLYQLLIGGQIVDHDESSRHHHHPRSGTIHQVLRELTQNELRMIQMCINRMIGMQATMEDINTNQHGHRNKKTIDREEQGNRMPNYFTNKIWIDNDQRRHLQSDRL